MVTVLTDTDIAARLDARSAVGWMREALLAAHSGALHSPPRVSTDLDALASPQAHTLGLVGTGVQTWNQLWAISVIRELTEVTVFSRDPVRRNAFATKVSGELGLPVVAAATARETVEGKDLVVLATNSPVPVIEASWVKPGSYVTTLGPKQFGRAEFRPDLVARADVAVTDSLAQTAAYDPPFVLTGTVQHDRLTSLGAVLAGDALAKLLG